MDQLKSTKDALVSLANVDDVGRIEGIVHDDTTRFSALNDKLLSQFKHLDDIYMQSAQVH